MTGYREDCVLKALVWDTTELSSIVGGGSERLKERRSICRYIAADTNRHNATAIMILRRRQLVAVVALRHATSSVLPSAASSS